MNTETRLKEIKAESDIISTRLHEKNLEFDFEKSNSFKDWEDHQEPESSALGKLGRERRMIMSPEFSELPEPEFGHIMTLKDFIENVECGGFIDYDGYGNYVRDNKKSNINIYPSDIRHDSIRAGFDTIIWFNR